MHPPSVLTLRRLNRSGSSFLTTPYYTEEEYMAQVRGWQWLSMIGLIVLASLAGPHWTALADETCQSPYLPKITGQEDFVYVWTLGVDGMGDGSDKLVTIGGNPQKTDQYGKV